MITEYKSIYDEEIKDLLVELQNHIKDIDREEYSVLECDFREEYFKKLISDVSKYNGKILLYKEDSKIVGLVVGLINNDKIDGYDVKVPITGRITDLVVSTEVRFRGIGTKLLKEMENYLKEVGCRDILLGVLAYNKEAINFYEKNGYHVRVMDMIKVDSN